MTEQNTSDIKIIPAILATSFLYLEKNLERVKGEVDTVQIDVCDGVFTPKPCWPYVKEGGSITVDENFKKVLDQEIGMPFWGDFSFEIDMMVSEPEKKIDDFITAGADRVVVHLRSTDKENLKACSRKAKEANVKIGLGVPFNCYVNELDGVMEDFDFVQVMGIEKVGFQNQEFQWAVLDTIKNIRNKYPELIISTDGGEDENDISDLCDAGANILIIGHALFNSPDIKSRLAEFYSLI